VALTVERTTLTVDGAARAALARASDGEVPSGGRPEHIVFSDRPAESGLLSITGTVDTVEPLGHTTLVRAKMASGRRLSALIAGKTRLGEGESVYATFPPNRLYLFDRKSERALLGIVE
ncbi:MAG: TOBE domain-containing protein, partial [Roseiarcus sp.]